MENWPETKSHFLPVFHPIMCKKLHTGLHLQFYTCFLSFLIFFDQPSKGKVYSSLPFLGSFLSWPFSMLPSRWLVGGKFNKKHKFL